MSTRWWPRSVVAPIAVVISAYALWLLSDRWLSIGPLDRATFGWLVVVPVWLLASVAAAVAWRSLTPAQVRMAAASSVFLIGGAATILLWLALASDGSACDLGPRTPAVGWIVPALVVGVLVGAAPSLGGLLSAQRVSLGRRWTAAAMAIGVDLAVSATAVLAATMFIVLSGGCQRPV